MPDCIEELTTVSPITQSMKKAAKKKQSSRQHGEKD